MSKNIRHFVPICLIISFASMVTAQEFSAPEIEKQEILLEVAGEVEEPGMYAHKQGERVWDAIQNAGGVTKLADLSDINLAAPLLDASRLYIPKMPLTDKKDRTLSNNHILGAADLNPPQYTRSGWQWLHHTGQLGNGVKAEPTSKTSDAKDSGKTNDLVNLNTATKAELETLPGIGPVTADKIIAYRDERPFQSIDDLEKVPGIGPQKMGAVRSLVRVK